MTARTSKRDEARAHPVSGKKERAALRKSIEPAIAEPVESSGEISKADESSDITPLARYGWVSGIAGAVIVIAMGYLASRRGALEHGWNFYPSAAQGDPKLAAPFALLVCAVAMFVIELAVRLRVDRGRVLSVADDVRARRYGKFFASSALVYVVELGILSGVLSLYKVLNEYGYARNHPYYGPWFAILPYVWWIYALGGLPYVLATRAFQSDPNSDRKQAAFVAMKGLRALAHRAGLAKTGPRPFDKYDRTAVLGLFVKAFFVPLMTVFFADQFNHLVSNWGYVLDTVLGGGKPAAVADVWNVSHSLIFSVDVGLAWAGYVLSSRWIKNTLFSVEPTLLGWAVALGCYTPFQNILNYYFSTPAENSFLSLDNSTAVGWLAACSIASFAVYTASTACFGLRFSNLTHRGIVTTGPYAIIRHPAYTAKNFSWWCIMFPFALHQWIQGEAAAAYQILGLVVLTSLYAARAITEERHLGKDPEYRRYAARVRYRFIPGVI